MSRLGPRPPRRRSPDPRSGATPGASHQASQELPLEERLRAELHRRADAFQPSPDLTRRIQTRVRRRSQRRRLALSATAGGAAVALVGAAATVAVVLRSGPPTKVETANAADATHTAPLTASTSSGQAAAGSSSPAPPASAASGSTVSTAAPTTTLAPTATTTGQPTTTVQPTTTGQQTTTTPPASPTTTTTSAPTEGSQLISAAPCTSAQLAVRLAPAPGQSTVGRVGEILVLTDNSAQPCEVHGYVGLLQLGARDQPIHTVVDWGSTYFDPDHGPQVIVLRPQDSASTDVAWTSASGSCDPPAPTLEVTPPNQATQIKLPFGQRVCDGGTIHTTALVPGSSGPAG